MKNNTISFLFFCFAFTNMVGLLNSRLMSQTIKDSTLFYYKSITEIKDINITSNAFDFFKNKTEESLLKRDTIKAAYYLELISLGQFKMGFYNDSESTIIKAYRLLEAIKRDKKSIAPRQRLSNQLGMIYRRIGDFKNSKRYYKEALELNESYIDKIAIITNIANNYADQNQYFKAVSYLNKHYHKVLALKNSNIKATYLDNLGFFQSKTNNPSALKNMKLALKIRINTSDLMGLFYSYLHLSIYSFEKENTKEAYKYLKMNKIVSDSLNNPKYKKEALQLILKQENNPFFEKYVELNKSIEKENQTRENKFAAIKYNVSEKEKIIKKKELELKSSELQKEKEKKLKIIYLLLGISGFFTSIFIFSYIKSKHKREKIQQVYITETRISKKVHDEVANDIYQIMTKLQEAPSIEENILDDLDNVYSKTRDISREHSDLEVNLNFETTLNDLFLSYRSDNINIITRNIPKIKWNTIDPLKKITLYRVLQELMVNMKKHSQATNVALTFNQSNKKINITYIDNGMGCIIKKGTGLLNMENRIKSINGTIIFESEINKGFKVKIII